MAIVCIAGVAPGIGKTAVAELLLSQVQGWAVARVRTADEVGEAGAALLAGAEYRVLPLSRSPDADPEMGRLMAAAAGPASILLAEPRGLDVGIKALLRTLTPGAINLLVEGNAFLWAGQADLSVMVLGAGPSGKGLARVRQSVREIFPKIDVWTWNSRADPHTEGFFEFPQALAKMGFRETVSNRADFHLVRPRDAADKDSVAFLDCVREHLERRQPGTGNRQQEH